MKTHRLFVWDNVVLKHDHFVVIVRPHIERVSLEHRGDVCDPVPHLAFTFNRPQLPFSPQQGSCVVEGSCLEGPDWVKIYTETVLADDGRSRSAGLA